VLDSLPAHKAKVVNEYVKSTHGKLEFHFLPGYAPDLNPDELVWNYMKRTGTARRPLGAGQSLQDNIEAEMLAIRRNPALVRSFFRAPTVAYITD
jgi:transposase